MILILSEEESDPKVWLAWKINLFKHSINSEQLSAIRHFLLFIILMAPLRSWSIGYFEYSHTAKEAYDQIFSLRFQEARSTLVRLKVTEPENLILHSLENYMDCLAIFIGERSDTYDKLKDQKQIRLDLIKDGDSGSPYYLYTQADIHLQWAIARVKFEDYFQAVMEIKRAFSLLNRNVEMFPDFMPNKKNLGILHALIGTVPDQYRWGLRLLGMTGTIAQGRGEIEEVLHYADRNEFVFRDEIYVMYAYFLLHLENSRDDAWKVLQRAKLNPNQNPLACFVTANVAMQTGRNDLAITILEQKPEGSQYFSFPYLSLMEGVARLNKLDKTADSYLLSFIHQTQGQHYIKEAYQKLAWHSILTDQPVRYQQYMKACREHGASVIDEDLTALHEARLDRIPDKNLLVARLLFDGGYYERADRYLKEVSRDKYGQMEQMLEYDYRLGRINHALGNFDSAFHYYEQTIKNGQHEGYYYACNSALMQGIIYEIQKKYDLATMSYKLVLDMNPDEYRASLHQKAKAGLQRISHISP